MQTILIADDSKTMQRLIQRIVQKDYQVVGVANNGAEAFEIYKSQRPNITLLDLTMPNCTGKECLEMIMALDPTAYVVIVSGINDEKTVQDCLKIGAKAFINKDNIIASESPEKCPLINTLKTAGAGSAA